ncbi:sigma factor-like helix-turn-helix DNA-binding protein [Candidatus Manganitrophus noduliformans]|uniref:RNA polymerase sigma-70 region 4 domain-containing protein n=1 Tax=Candidatus Manganitrophus noduliformans TaxID=2606439 RepID=A0A7X6DUB5_9BACT|nr:sigma factor-like helix-turn-helix DNA-binding protein [Candidatus Manganitrophus noduliformans]NKE73543.1 hypothetical protein [Candidatus Manganitrophus noduliformans]
MFDRVSGGFVLDETGASLFSEVAKMVRDEIDLLEVSSRCRVNPTTLRKILEARPVSHYTEKKIRTALGLTALSQAEISNRPSTVERLRELHRIYREKKSLAAVGRTMGLSRERVRQLLVRGAKIGLFEYPFPRPSVPSRRKILDDYKKCLRLDAAAEVNRLSLESLRRLCRSYRITREELAKIRSDRQQMACVDLYILLAQEVGHHPTATELLRLKAGRSLQWQIRKGWGSLRNFRKALGITPPLPRRRKQEMRTRWKKA